MGPWPPPNHRADEDEYDKQGEGEEISRIAHFSVSERVSEGVRFLEFKMGSNGSVRAVRLFML